MAVADAHREFGSWSVEDHAIRIEYAVDALEEVCANAVDGQYQFRHGGMEVGGVLYGRAAGDLIRIVAYRPLECEHAFGPRFALSERDRAALKALLYAPRQEADLRGLEPVGWYHSHTRSGIELSPRDLEIYDSYFPQRWQVALVLRPDNYGPVRAGFFFRERDNSVQAEGTYREFTVLPRRHGLVADLGQEAEAPRAQPEPEPADRRPRRQAAQSARKAPPSEAVAAADAEAAFLPLEVPGFARWQPWQGWKWVWVLLTVVLVGAAGAGGVEYYIQSAPPPPLSLRVADVGGQLLIDWDRTAKPIRDAPNATLEIRDGSQFTTRNLTAEILREGSVSYVRMADVVDVRLRVQHRGRAISDLVRFLGQPVERTSAAEEAVARQRDDLKAQLDALRGELDAKDAQIRKLRGRIGARP